MAFAYCRLVDLKGNIMVKINKRFFLALALTAAFVNVAGKANGSLIDLGERDLGVNLMVQSQVLAFIESDQGLPSGTLTYLTGYDQDMGFLNNGAVDNSHFGVTIFDGGINAMASWDLGTAGFQLSYVFVKDGRETRGGPPFLYHIYGVTPDERFDSLVAQLVTINDFRQIQKVGFYGVPGSPAVPEGGATLVLLGSALCAVELTRRTVLRRTAQALI